MSRTCGACGSPVAGEVCFSCGELVPVNTPTPRIVLPGERTPGGSGVLVVCQGVRDSVVPMLVDSTDVEPGNYTSGEGGLPCGPATYVADAEHDDDHLLKGRRLQKMGVKSRRELVALMTGGLTPKALMAKARK